MSVWLTSSQISQIFTEEIVTANGKVTDSCEDQGRLFTRGVMPPSVEVAPHDNFKGGVALCATDTDIFIHPYVFRIVCTNGAIMAKATQTRHITRDNQISDIHVESSVETAIRDAIRACCQPEAFIFAANQIRSSREVMADMAITFAAFLTTHRGATSMKLLKEILRRYDQASDQSAYGLMNAITSVARDTRDPETKWRLEELGGGIPAKLGHTPAVPSRARAAARSLVEVN